MSDAWISSGFAIAAWLATYAIHSTVLLVIAWIVARTIGDRPALTSAIWKVATVAGIFTASLSSSLAIEPLAGRTALETSPPQPTIAVVSVPAQDLASVTSAAVDRLPAPPIDPEPAVASAPPPAPVPTSPVWPALLAFAWIVGAALALGSLIAAHVRLWAILRTTRPASPAVRRAFAAVLGRAPIERVPALLESDAVIVPFATGVLVPIIVVPACAADRLTSAALRTMLAHELAHVLRRDPMWRVLLVALERVFFFQPLLRLARRGVEHDAEYLCDAWAASRTEAPLELARCLTEIASWGHAARRLVLAPTMAEPRSILRRRVLRLLASDAATPSSPRRVLLASVLVCAVLPFVAPVIGAAEARPRTIVIRTSPQEDVPRQITIITPDRGPIVVANEPHASAPAAEGRAEERARKKSDRKTTRELRHTIRRARRDDRVPTADEIAQVLGATEEAFAPPHIARVDDMVIVVDADALEEARAIAAELDAIIAGSAAVAEAARANAHRRRAESSRVLEHQARALRQRAAAHRDAARALRMRVIGEHAAPMLAPAPPAPPAPPARPLPPPAPPRRDWAPDIVPAVAPVP